MSLELLRDYYQERDFSTEQTKNAVEIVIELDDYLKTKGQSLIEAAVNEVENFVSSLMKIHKLSKANLLAMTRYFYLTNQKDIYIYLASLLGSEGVMENIKDRIQESEGKLVVDAIFSDIEFPPLGTPLELMPKFTQKVMRSIKSKLLPEKYRPLLASNNHGIPEVSMLEEKKHYHKANSLSDYLRGRHERKVAELQLYCDQKKLWYEQYITQEVVDFVQSNQEILSAVRQNDELYVTKIPYNPVNFLLSNDKKQRLYHSCHCPFVRKAILDDQINVEPDWCYCSAGFAKYPFEVILDTTLEAEVLASPLLGDELCRFRIKLPENIK